MSQNLYVSKSPRGFVCMFKFKKRGTKAKFLRKGWQGQGV